MLVIILYTLLYIEKEQKQTEKEGQRRDGLPSCPPRPLPLLQVVRTADRTEERENQGEGCRRRLRPFLASLLFCLLSSPSTPSPAAHPHHVAPATRERDGRPPRPLLGEAIATPRHRSTSKQQTAAGARLDGLPSSPPRPLPRLSSPLPGGEGRAASQPGRAIPSSSPRRPSPPCRGASEYMRTPPEAQRRTPSHSRAAGLLGEKVCFGIFCAVVSL